MALKQQPNVAHSLWHVMHGMCSVGIVLLVLLDLLSCVSGQVPFRRHLSESRVQELHNLGKNLRVSINSEKYACDTYYDYVCSHHLPLFSILGHLPKTSDVMDLQEHLENDPDDFQTKHKLIDFHVSCLAKKDIDDCYRETFEYFKPVFGYIIVKKYIRFSTNEHRTFMELLEAFLKKSDNTFRNDRYPPTYYQINLLREKFSTPEIYFKRNDLDYEYRNLQIYRDGYVHNIRNLEEFRRQNLTYATDIHRTMLDWSLYMFQSRNKPMSYYYSTFNVHLWMTMYNTTVRSKELKQMEQIADCLNLQPFVKTLGEARILAVVYLQSFRRAWEEYREWIDSSPINKGIYEHENAILKDNYRLSNDHLFFTFYAQNFCDFGKDLAESVFYLGLYQKEDFYKTYSCGFQTIRGVDCI